MTEVPLPRLRQVALVAADLPTARADVEAALGVDEPFADPGVGEFGLANAVYEVGDTFLEIVSPRTAGTAAGRYLERRGGDAGYMALFQVADTATARRRLSELGVRTVWQIDLDDISGTHLHPKDVPGAIVSLDTPRPPASWRWAGPRWTGTAPSVARGSITGITVALVDVAEGMERWRAVLDTDRDGDSLLVAGGAQRVVFVPAARPEDEGIVELHVERDVDVGAVICGVRITGG